MVCFKTAGMKVINLSFYELGFGRLSMHTLATNATHAPGYAELDIHNMFGLLEERATHTALQEILPGKRPFIIARSTFPSSGKWSGHWVYISLLCFIAIKKLILIYSWATT